MVVLQAERLMEEKITRGLLEERAAYSSLEKVTFVDTINESINTGIANDVTDYLVRRVDGHREGDIEKYRNRYLKWSHDESYRKSLLDLIGGKKKSQG